MNLYLSFFIFGCQKVHNIAAVDLVRGKSPLKLRVFNLKARGRAPDRVMYASMIKLPLWDEVNRGSEDWRELDQLELLVLQDTGGACP